MCSIVTIDPNPDSNQSRAGAPTIAHATGEYVPGPAEETPKNTCGKTVTDFSPELQDAQTPETRKAQSCV